MNAQFSSVVSLWIIDQYRKSYLFESLLVSSFQIPYWRFTVFWDDTPCCSADRYQLHGWTYHVNIQCRTVFCPEDRGIRVFRSTDTCQPDYTTLHSSRRWHSLSPPGTYVRWHLNGWWQGTVVLSLLFLVEFVGTTRATHMLFGLRQLSLVCVCGVDNNPSPSPCLPSDWTWIPDGCRPNRLHWAVWNEACRGCWREIYELTSTWCRRHYVGHRSPSIIRGIKKKRWTGHVARTDGWVIHTKVSIFEGTIPCVTGIMIL
jgi:hypothetical protein